MKLRKKPNLSPKNLSDTIKAYMRLIPFRRRLKKLEKYSSNNVVDKDTYFGYVNTYESLRCTLLAINFYQFIGWGNTKTLLKNEPDWEVEFKRLDNAYLELKAKNAKHKEEVEELDKQLLEKQKELDESDVDLNTIANTYATQMQSRHDIVTKAKREQLEKEAREKEEKEEFNKQWRRFLLENRGPRFETFKRFLVEVKNIDEEKLKNLKPEDVRF